MSAVHPARSSVAANDRAPQLDDGAVEPFDAQDRPIGEILGETKRLSAAQIDQILLYHRKHGVRFGQAAVALRLASDEDVLWALSKQYHYPYAAAAPSRRYDELVVASHPFGARAEAFRELRSQLMMDVLAPEEARRALAVVSADVGDGKTFIAANLAVAFSQLGVHTLLIDMDMRTPRQHEVFGMENRSGLSNILSGRSEANVIRPVDDLPSLFVLPAGPVPPNSLELLQRLALSLLIRELLPKFDYVVVDTPATAHGADARVIAATCGAALAVGLQGHSSMASMHKLVTSLAKGPAKLAGVVLNDHP